MMDFVFIALCCVTLVVKSTAYPDNNHQRMDDIEKYDEKDFDDKNVQFKSNALSNLSAVAAFTLLHRPHKLAVRRFPNFLGRNLPWWLIGSSIFRFGGYGQRRKRVLPRQTALGPITDINEVGFCGYYQRTNTLTASGWPYKKSKFTAAHPSLPLNTMVLVSNGVNGVVVKINDRVKSKGHILDLSLAAAKALRIQRNHMVRCSLKVLQMGDGKLRGDPTARKACKLTWFGSCRKPEECCSGNCKKSLLATKGRCEPGTTHTRRLAA